MDKLVSIEVPTCNKEKFEKIFLNNLEFFSLISDYVKFNINFQKEFSEEDIKKYLTLFQNYNLQVSWGIFTYTNPPGFISLVQFREDCHQLDNKCPFVFSMDDDIEIINDQYIKTFLSCLLYIIGHPQVNVVCVEGYMYRRNIGRRTNIIEKCTSVHRYWTDGGILVRNNSEDKRLFPVECYQLLGCHQDWLLVKLRLQNQKLACRVISNSFHHYEKRKSMKDAGCFVHGWKIGDLQENNISKFLHNLNVDFDYMNKYFLPPFDFSKLEIADLIEELKKYE